MNKRQHVGHWGENTAIQFLQKEGYEIVARNFRTPHGEIDILARKDDLLVFVEVKTRSSVSFAFPEDSVTRRKQAHMLSAAEYYLERNPDSNDNWQFDVLAIIGKPGGNPQITHFENVIA